MYFAFALSIEELFISLTTTNPSVVYKVLSFPMQRSIIPAIRLPFPTSSFAHSLCDIIPINKQKISLSQSSSSYHFFLFPSYQSSSNITHI